MKVIAVLGLLIAFATGPLHINPQFKRSDIIRQNCDTNKNGSLVFFNLIALDHPLGQTTCSDDTDKIKANGSKR